MLIDISQEILHARVYPGDPAPKAEQIADMRRGDLYNLTAFSMSAHNGTHVDAPRHFIPDGKTVDELALEAFVGCCYVARHEGPVDADDAAQILENARKCRAAERILIAGSAVVTAEAAHVFAAGGVRLIGNESQSVGPLDAPIEVHQILLGQGIVLLEGLVLDRVREGSWFLSAAPLNLGGFEGAPCRAYLMER